MKRALVKEMGKLEKKVVVKSRKPYIVQKKKIDYGYAEERAEIIGRAMNRPPVWDIPAP